MAGEIRLVGVSEGATVTPTSEVAALSKDGGEDIQNLEISTSVAGNALTIAMKTGAGTDPTASDAVAIGFRSATETSGAYNRRTATAATSLVISSGSTLGHTSAVQGIIFVYALDNSGTIELAVSQSLFDQRRIQSTTAEGGAGGADSATVMYSTTARSNVPIRLIGMMLSTQTTAGTWAVVPQVASLHTNFAEGSATFLGLVKKNKYQIKALGASLSVTTDPVTDMTFSNLVVGRTYRISATAVMRITGTSALESVFLSANHNSAIIINMPFRADAVTDTHVGTGAGQVIFVAVATTVIFRWEITSGTALLLGTDTGNRQTFAMLEELNNAEVTTEF
jgi:hypothetical protein